MVAEETNESLKLSISLVQKVSIGPYETADCSMFVSGITVYSTEEEVVALVEQGKIAYAHMAGRLARMIADAKREKGWTGTPNPHAEDVPFDDEAGITYTDAPAYGGNGSQGAQQAVQAPPRPAPPSNPDNPACPDCGGPTEFKRGTSGPKSKKPGTPWQGYFCVNTKGTNEKHAAVFI